MKKIIQEKIKKLRAIKHAHLQKSRNSLKTETEKNKESWKNVAEYLGFLIAFITSQCTNPFVNPYGWLNNIFHIVTGIGIVVCLLLIKNEIFQLFPSGWVTNLKKNIFELPKRGATYFINHKLTAVSVLAVLALGIVGGYNYSKTEYYAFIAEIYGIPVGQGEPLSSEERQQKSGYWKIQDYRFQHRIVLTYQEPYGHMEVMKKYSTAYSMPLFQLSTRIEFYYEPWVRDSDDEHASDKSRRPKNIVYYGDNGKILMELKKIDDDRLEITEYSSDDRPQLFQSTLLRVPDDQSTETSISPRQIETIYNADGRPEVRRFSPYVYNSYGINGERYMYNQDGQLTTLYYLDINGVPVCNKLGIKMVSFQYEEDGNLHSIRYFSDDEGKEKTEGFHGVFCEKFEYDSHGNLCERCQLDRNENWWYDVNGVYKYQYTYENGALIQESFLARQEQPVRDKRFQTSSIRFAKSDFGNGEKIIIYFDPPGENTDTDTPVPEDVKEIPSAQWPQNEADVLVASAVLKTENPEEKIIRSNAPDSSLDLPENSTVSLNYNPALMSEQPEISRNYASIQYQINHKGCIEAISYHDMAGDFVKNEQGYAIKYYEYDKNMRIRQISYKDAAQKPCLINDGYGAVRYTYSDPVNNKLVSEEYLDMNGNLTMNRKLGYAVVSYDRKMLERGEEITSYYYDTSHNLVPLPEQGYAVKKQIYNESGLLSREIYYESPDKVTCRTDYMVAEIWYDYADDGNLIREWYKNADGKSVNRADTGYAVIYREFESGKKTKAWYEGIKDGELVPVSNQVTGISIINYGYKNGHVTRREYFDTKGMPVLSKDTGCAVLEYEYGANGQVKECRAYDTNKDLILRKDTGYAIVRWDYDEFGQESSVRYLGTDEEPVIHKKYLCAGFDYECDDNGNRTFIQYIGLDGLPMIRMDLGFAQLRKSYDKEGNLTGETYLDTKGKPLLRKEWDCASFLDIYEEGNCIENRYFDEQGKLKIRGDRGYAVALHQYNEQGQHISSRYFDEKLDPVISTEYHCAGFDYQYDEQGNRTVIKYIDLDGSYMVRKDLGYAMTERKFDTNGNIIEESYFDTDHVPVLKKDGQYTSYQDFFKNGKCIENRYYGTDGQLILRSDKGYAVAKHTYDEFGRTKSSRYYDTDGKTPVISTEYHCAGFDYLYDDNGNQTEIKYIGLNGKSISRTDRGYAKISITYNDIGDKISESYFDANDQPTVWKNRGYAKVSWEYENGHIVQTHYWDADGQPVLRNDTGVATIKEDYDPYGQIIRTFYLGVNKEPVIHKEKLCAGIKSEYDDKGNETVVEYIGLDGELIVNPKLGFAKKIRSYDNSGNLIAESFWDENGKPAIWKERGYASFLDTYKNGKLTESRTYDKNQQLVLRKDRGYAIAKFQYDKYGQCLSSRYYGTDGKTPIISSEYCCAGINFTYDPSGNETSLSYVGLDGKPMLRRDWGIAKIVKEYDHKGQLINESYYDTQNMPAYKKGGGYTSIRNTYENGRLTEVRTYDSDGNLTSRKDGGYAVISYAYNEFGQRKSIRYFGTDGTTPVINTENFSAGMDYHYDQKGNETEINYIGLNGDLINRKETGIATIKKEYDDTGNMIQESYFNHNGEPIEREDRGYSNIKYLYENGNIVETQYYDRNMHLKLRNGKGYAIEKKAYNQFYQCISKRYYGIDGRPVNHEENHCFGLDYMYSKFGMQTDTCYIGLNGDLINREDLGYARLHSDYDEFGNEIAVSYRNTENQPTASLEGGNFSIQKYYENGKITKIKYLDESGKLMNHNEYGYAIVQSTYNDLGQKVEKFFYDNDENPVIGKKDFCSGYVWEYDHRGNVIYEWYYGDEDGSDRHSKYDVDLLCTTYDKLDQKAEEAYYIYINENDDAELHNRKDTGYAEVQYKYDGFNCIEKSYYDQNGNYIPYPETDYATLKWKYNLHGQVTEKSFFNTNEQPVNNNYGVAVYEYQYDDVGHWIKTLRYDQNGEEV